MLVIYWSKWSNLHCRVVLVRSWLKWSYLQVKFWSKWSHLLAEMVAFRIYTVELYWSSTCPNGQIYGLNSGWNGEIYTVELYWSNTFHNGQILLAKYWSKLSNLHCRVELVKSLSKWSNLGLNSGRNGEIYTVELCWSSTGWWLKSSHLLVKF